MFSIIAGISHSVTQFCDRGLNRIPMICGYDHDAGSFIFQHALFPFLNDPRCRVIVLDGDSMCWSPGHCLAAVCRAVTGEQARDVDDVGETIQDVVSSEELFLTLERGFQRLSVKSGQRIILVMRRVDRLQMLFHYRGFEDVLDRFREFVISCGPKLHCCFEGRPPARRETSYERFMKTIPSTVHTTEPLDHSGLEHYYQLTGLTCSADTIDFVLTVSGGIFGYIRVLDQILPALCDLQGNITDKDEALAWIGRLLQDQQSTLALYCSRRYAVAIGEAKGFGSIRILMDILSRGDMMTLSECAKFMGRSPSAVKDYLDSLRDVGLVRREGKRYGCSEPLIAQWIRLNDCSFQRQMIEGMPSAISLSPRVKRPVPITQKPVRRDDMFIEFD